jgi:hypothetical protein
VPGLPAKYIDTRTVDPDELKPYPGNPNAGDVAVVQASVRANGQYRSVVARRLPDGTLELLAGHTTTRATKDELGRVRVEVIEADDATARRIVAADNQTARAASMDETALLALLDKAQADGGLDGTGFDEQAHRELVDRVWGSGGGGGGGEYDGDSGTGRDDEPPADETAPDETAPGVYPDDDVIDAAFAQLRADGFPYPNVPRYDAMQQINKLARTRDEALPNTIAAYHVADPYQRHRFETKIPGKETPLFIFGHDDRFRHALRLALDSGRITPSSALGALAFARNGQIAAQFRPGFALAMFRRFAPAGGTVLDTSTGYGGRLLGFIASHCAEYIGVDPDVRTIDGNQRLAADLCPPSKRVELHCLPAEDVAHEIVAGRADFAFTSPPYFGKEQYSDDPTQSWVRYPSGEQWRSGFLAPILALQYAALKPGAVNAVNIADVEINGAAYPLAEWTIAAATDAGFVFERVETFPVSRVPGRGADERENGEPVILLRKPTRGPGRARATG